MNLLSSDQCLNHITNIIHKDTQLQTHKIDLTVAAIHQFTEAGALDFGGSEFMPAAAATINPKKKNEDDDYGWWKLEGGFYKAFFNEKLALEEHHIALITLHEHACQAGVTGNTTLVTPKKDLELAFCVPACGCNIKQNARIAALYVFDLL